MVENEITLSGNPEDKTKVVDLVVLMYINMRCEWCGPRAYIKGNQEFVPYNSQI